MLGAAAKKRSGFAHELESAPCAGCGRGLEQNETRLEQISPGLNRKGFAKGGEPDSNCMLAKDAQIRPRGVRNPGREDEGLEVR